MGARGGRACLRVTVSGWGAGPRLQLNLGSARGRRVVPRPLAAPTGQGSAPGGTSSRLRCRDGRFCRGRGHGAWEGSGAGQAPWHPQSMAGMVFLSSRVRLSTWKLDGHWARPLPVPFAPGLLTVSGNSAEGTGVATVAGGPVRLACPRPVCLCRFSFSQILPGGNR